MPDPLNVVIDISHHNGNVNLKKAADDGILGVIIKARISLKVSPKMKLLMTPPYTTMTKEELNQHYRMESTLLQKNLRIIQSSRIHLPLPKCARDFSTSRSQFRCQLPISRLTFPSLITSGAR